MLRVDGFLEAVQHADAVSFGQRKCDGVVDVADYTVWRYAVNLPGCRRPGGRGYRVLEMMTLPA